MATLLWRKSKTRTVEVPESPFKREEEFEQFVFSNDAVVGGQIHLLKRQIRHGGKATIPDIIGIDDTGQVCIIELKNSTVGVEVVPQVLGYAMWAQRNPDSIKSLWLQADDRPDDIEPNWDDLQVRVLIVAPGFDADLARMAAKVNYPIEMISVKRYGKGRSEILWIDQRSADTGETVRPTEGLPTYNRGFYEGKRGKEATTRFLIAVKSLADASRAEGWKLEQKANKNYVGFKREGRILFGITWSGARAWRLFIKIPQARAKQSSVAGWKQLAYSRTFHHATFAPSDESLPRFKSVVPLLRAAWDNASLRIEG